MLVANTRSEKGCLEEADPAASHSTQEPTEELLTGGGPARASSPGRSSATEARARQVTQQAARTT